MSDPSVDFISVGPHGTFRPSGELNSTPEQIEALFQRLGDSACEHIVLYFHGGLVPEKSGKQSAESLAPVFTAAGAQPIFFIWDTGPWETIRDNLGKMLSIALVKKLLLFVLGQVTKRWGIELAGKGPGQGLSEVELQAELAKDRPFESWDEAEIDTGGGRGGAQPLDEASLALQGPEIQAELFQQISADSFNLETVMQDAAGQELLDPELRQGGEDVLARGIDPAIIFQLTTLTVKVTKNVLARRTKRTDHGLYPTVVEELLRAVGLDGAGKALWNAMKEKAAEMWLPNPEPLSAENTPDAHVGTHFLQRLVAYKAAHSGLAVDLVGHSAGSIVICQLLHAAAARFPDFRFGRIALLAPGATTELVHTELASKPERYESFRMYTMQDKWECLDAIAGPVYPRSLLYFVSGVLEDEAATPISGLARCATGSAPYNTGFLLGWHDFLHAADQQRLVLSLVDGNPPGLNSNAAHHGDFDNEEVTRANLQAFLRR